MVTTKEPALSCMCLQSQTTELGGLLLSAFPGVACTSTFGCHCSPTLATGNSTFTGFFLQQQEGMYTAFPCTFSNSAKLSCLRPHRLLYGSDHWRGHRHPSQGSSKQLAAPHCVHGVIMAQLPALLLFLAVLGLSCSPGQPAPLSTCQWEGFDAALERFSKIITV